MSVRVPINSENDNPWIYAEAHYLTVNSLIRT
jgi:hypothetical protein